jgi:hypothetical protein
MHARYVGAAETEDLSRWLVAWDWHNPNAKDRIWSIMECARNLGREIAAAEASAITEEASITRRHLSADNLARFLGVTYAQRQALGITTIGSINVGKRARKELRKRKDRLAKERRRRAQGARHRSESLSRTRPWEAMNMSRRTWERHRNKARDANSSTPICLSSEDTLATAERKQVCPPSGPSAREGKQGAIRLPTACKLAVDIYATLPIELRFAALCLPFSELRQAA